MAVATKTELALELLAAGEMTGRELRFAIHNRGHHMGAVRFYSFMASLESRGEVVGRWEDYEFDGHNLRRRCYSLPIPGGAR